MLKLDNAIFNQILCPVPHISYKGPPCEDRKMKICDCSNLQDRIRLSFFKDTGKVLSTYFRITAANPGEEPVARNGSKSG